MHFAQEIISVEVCKITKYFVRFFIVTFKISIEIIKKKKHVENRSIFEKEMLSQTLK